MGDNVLNDVISVVTTNSNLPIGTVMYDGSMIPSAMGASTLSPVKSAKDVITNLLDAHHLNQVIIDHKVSEQELMRLKEVSPNFAEEIKESISREVARDISKKVSYTKKTIEDTHHYLGRVWVFTTEEITQLLEEARNV